MHFAFIYAQDTSHGLEVNPITAQDGAAEALEAWKRCPESCVPKAES